MPRRAIITTTVTLAVALALSFALAGCSNDSTPEVGQVQAPVAPAASKVLLFDMAHREIFGPEDTSELGQSMAVERIRRTGFDVRVNTAKFTPESLKGVAGVMLAGPMLVVNESEQDALESYVRGGGTLLVTAHVPFAIMKLPERFGLGFGNAVVMSTEAAPGTDPGVFVADGIADDDLTEGVDSVFVLSGWEVKPTGESASILVSTPSTTWADIDHDEKRTDADASGPLGMVGVARLGAGTVIIVGDDAVFANAGIGQADNMRLFDNVLRLMATYTMST